MLVARSVHHDDGGPVHAGQIIQRKPKAVRLVAVRFEKLLHVQQREAHLPDHILIPGRVHGAKHLLLADLAIIVIAQKRGQGG